MNTVITKTISLYIAGEVCSDCLVDIYIYYAPDEYESGFLYCPGEVEIEKIIAVNPVQILDFNGNTKYTIEAGKDLIDLMTDDNIYQLECKLMYIARNNRK